MAHRTVKQFSTLLNGYHLLCIMLFISQQEFCEIFQCSFYVSKYKTIYSQTTPHENSQMFGDPADSYPRIIPRTTSQQPLHFRARPHTQNACKQASHTYSNSFCSKSLRKMILEASKVLLSTELNSVLYCCISALISLYEICIFTSPLSAFTLLQCSSECPCIRFTHKIISKMLEPTRIFLFPFL